jgi:hypothetical protein
MRRGEDEYEKKQKTPFDRGLNKTTGKFSFENCDEKACCNYHMTSICHECVLSKGSKIE